MNNLNSTRRLADANLSVPGCWAYPECVRAQQTVPACLPACLPYLPRVGLPACLPACLRSFLPSFLPAPLTKPCPRPHPPPPPSPPSGARPGRARAAGGGWPGRAAPARTAAPPSVPTLPHPGAASPQTLEFLLATALGLARRAALSEAVHEAGVLVRNGCGPPHGPAPRSPPIWSSPMVQEAPH